MNNIRTYKPYTPAQLRKILGTKLAGAKSHPPTSLLAYEDGIWLANTFFAAKVQGHLEASLASLDIDIAKVIFPEQKGWSINVSGNELKLNTPQKLPDLREVLNEGRNAAYYNHVDRYFVNKFPVEVAADHAPYAMVLYNDGIKLRKDYFLVASNCGASRAYKADRNIVAFKDSRDELTGMQAML